jgi:hypothetical protein
MKTLDVILFSHFNFALMVRKKIMKYTLKRYYCWFQGDILEDLANEPNKDMSCFWIQWMHQIHLSKMFSCFCKMAHDVLFDYYTSKLL